MALNFISKPNIYEFVSKIHKFKSEKTTYRGGAILPKVFWQKNSAIWGTPFVLGAYIENDPYCAFLSTPTCEALPAIQNITTYSTGRRGQKGAVGIIFYITGIILAKNGDFA